MLIVIILNHRFFICIPDFEYTHILQWRSVIVMFIPCVNVYICTSVYVSVTKTSRETMKDLNETLRK